MSLTPDAIRQVATAERSRLAALREWAAAYSGAHEEDPLLVHVALPMRDYYIVQFVKDHRTSGLMLIDAVSGKLGSVTRIEYAPDTVYRFLRPADIPPLVERYARKRTTRDDTLSLGQRPPDLPDDVRAGDVTVHPVLYWEPCDQSVTPFYPLYRVEYSGPNGAARFLVRVDGEIFTEITTGGRGL
jgi:hypothetical protein